MAARWASGRPKRSTIDRTSPRRRIVPSVICTLPVPRALARTAERSRPAPDTLASPASVPDTVSGELPNAATCATSTPASFARRLALIVVPSRAWIEPS